MKKVELASKMSRSKFSISDKGDPRGKRMEFVPQRTKTLFDKKVPTHEQFFKDIKRTGNINIYYKGRKIAERGI